jgi:hypothetical protein
VKTPVCAAAAALWFALLAPCASHAGDLQGPTRISFTVGSVRETFVSTPNGGIEDAVVTRPSPHAVHRLRAQTRQRAAAFARGTFVDPTNPHGDLVPGLREMRRQWNRLRVTYQNLPMGARIRYTTNDPVMVEALHQWFAARAVKKVR